MQAARGFHLTDAQREIVEAPLEARIYLEGPAGSGKTTAAAERLLTLMAQGVDSGSLLVLTPQRTLAAPYFQALQEPGVLTGGLPAVLTVGGLAQRMTALFWPLASQAAGFGRPDLPPLFLTLETAQYTMAHLLRPLLLKGYFESVTIDRNRLYSQILDNLNKSAAVGFSYTVIGERLQAASDGAPEQKHVYEDVQTCATLFREHCLAHNLLDFSLQLEVFWRYLWPDPLCRRYLMQNYRHLVFDNIEEDIPRAHDLVSEWLPELDSALLVFDQDAGYRRFLGADPHTAAGLASQCELRITLSGSFTQSPPVQSLTANIIRLLAPQDSPAHASQVAEAPSTYGIQALKFANQRFFPQMIDWVVEQIDLLVHQQGTPPGEIVALAPFVSDSLRFALANRLAERGIPLRSHRPSRSLRDEPVTQCLLNLARLAHPEWGALPSRFDFAYVLVQALAGMDLVRAQLLADIVYRIRDGLPSLSAFEDIRPAMQQRISYVLGERYETLRAWLASYSQQPVEEMDVFLSRLFGELLSQPGFGFHSSLTAGETAANLIESIQKFRWAAGEMLAAEGTPLGREYTHMLQEGVLAAQYLRSWQEHTPEAVYLAPAYTFLISNRPVDYQFWLDAGSRGWFERLNQPLTHPYVLSREWMEGRVWNSADEYLADQDALYRLVLGLLRRCRQAVYLGLSELGEQGYEQRGPLLTALQRVLRSQPRTQPGRSAGQGVASRAGG